MSRDFKNILRKEKSSEGVERRKNLMKEVLQNSTPIPSPVDYKDVDEEFKRWVEEDLHLSFEGSEVPTMALFSNQRFTEFMQSWANVDDKRNLILNFKTITRENNPKYGTINGTAKNIPGERTYLMNRVKSVDDAGRVFYTDYRVKQPIPIDFIYGLSIVTNKYELLNTFNLMINDKFKAIQCYIRPKGHFMAMKLNDISDESEYSIDNRQFYSQSYSITVMGYIMTEDSFIVEEREELKMIGFEGDVRKGTYADIEELPNEYKDELNYDAVPVLITLHFCPCDSSYKFNIDCNFKADKIILDDNVIGFNFYVNDKKTELDDTLEVKIGDEIRISNLTRYRMAKEVVIKIEGRDTTSSYDKTKEEKIIEITN